MLTLLLLLACTGDTKNDDTSNNTGDDSADTSGDSGSGDTDTGPTCSTLNSGDDWGWNGECPQMRTPCDIVVDGCSLTIDYTNEEGGVMTMGMPYEGTIEGDTITFADGDSVTGCVGTIEDADTVSGTCDDGCEFTLRR